MIWQDLIVACASVLFSYSLIFQVFYGFKEKKGFVTLQTSLLTTIGTYAVGIVYFTIKLYITTIITFVNGSMWLLLFIQRIIYKKAK